jgi:hypothetical protein
MVMKPKRNVTKKQAEVKMEGQQTEMSRKKTEPSNEQLPLRR